jgi:hypothetical protein
MVHVVLCQIGGEESCAEGGAVLSSGKVKEAVLCVADDAVLSGGEKGSVLTGTGGAVPGRKVKEAVLCGAGGAMASGKVKEVVPCGVGKGKEGVLGVGVGGGGICKSAVGSERLRIVCQLPGTNRQ